MGWGTQFKTEIFLSKEIYNSIYEIKDEIEDIKKNINYLESKVLILIGSTPKDIIPEDWNEEPNSWLVSEFNGIKTEIESDYQRLFRLELFLDYLETNNIDPKNLPRD